MQGRAFGHAALIREQQQIRDAQQISESPIMRSIPEAVEPYRNNNLAQGEEEQRVANA